MAATPTRASSTPAEVTPEKLALPQQQQLCPALATVSQGKASRCRQMAIVLTGGPCSGKSSVLALIRDRLSKRGIQVVTVPEYATHFFANSDGFQVEWVGTEKEEGLQNVLLKYQMMQEDLFRDFAGLNTKTSVLLLDRGTLDQKVFTSSEDIWFAALKRNNITEQELLDRYDMVMHLGTCAKVGNYEWGPNSNNPGRYHNPEEASRLDKVCEEVYKGHRQLRTVPHCEKFADKVDLVMKYLEDALGVDGLVASRRRQGVELIEGVPEEVLSGSRAFVVTTTYLDDPLQLSVRRTLEVPVASWHRGLLDGADALALLGEAGRHDLHQAFEERCSIPEESTLARRSIPEEMYHNCVRLSNRPSVHKHVLSFQGEGGSHHELFFFQDSGRDKLILDHPEGQPLPSWIRAEAVKAAAVVGPKARQPRILKQHSTEEAAAVYLDKSLC